jgi:hypothetical protein
MDFNKAFTNTLALPIDKMLYIYLLCPHSEHPKKNTCGRPPQPSPLFVKPLAWGFLTLLFRNTRGNRFNSQKIIELSGKSCD